MIPKIIHYCWLSNDPYPKHIEECINSWHKFLPDYEFMLWNFNRFPKGKSIWVDQAFNYHKYAFAADYIRMYALYNYGGFYLDTDVEVLKSFDSLLNLDIAICWQKDVPGLEVAAFGVKPKSSLIKACLDRYDNRPFVTGNGTFDIAVLPEIFEQNLRKIGCELLNVDSVENAFGMQKNVIPIFASEFFSPKSYKTKQTITTSNTFCIHHFEGSWKKQLWYEKIDSWLTRNTFIRLHVLSGLVRRYRKTFVKHQ